MLRPKAADHTGCCKNLSLFGCAAARLVWGGYRRLPFHPALFAKYSGIDIILELRVPEGFREDAKAELPAS